MLVGGTDFQLRDEST